MAIREKLRKTFGGKKKESSSDSTGSSTSSETFYTGRKDIEYYKPHEIPKSKYRGRVDPEHKDRLDAYSFADAFTEARRRSSQAFSGIMSPGGTKSQSRRASYMSYASKGTAATPAAKDVQDPLSRRPTVAGVQSAAQIRENSDDDTDRVNTGLSTPNTTKQSDQNVPIVRLEREATASEHESDATTPANNFTYDQPFTAAELEKAMTRATVKGVERDSMSAPVAIVAH